MEYSFYGEQYYWRKDIIMEVPKKIPEFKKGNLDSHSKTELHLSFQRIYEYIDVNLKELSKELKRKIESGDISSSGLNDLIGVFSAPLAGSSITDPLLQSILQSFGPQDPNHVFAGPIPSFRDLTLVDLPAGATGYDTIQDEDIPLAQKAIINFKGAGVIAATVGATTEVTIPGGAIGLSVFDILNM